MGQRDQVEVKLESGRRQVVQLQFFEYEGREMVRLYTVIGSTERIRPTRLQFALELNYALPHGAMAVKDEQLVMVDTLILADADPGELEEDVSVYPVFSLDWKMGPDVRLRTRGGPYQGGTLEWVWSPSDFFQAALSAGYERQRFRLANKGPNPDGIAEATSVPLLLGMKFRASRFNLVVEGGMAVSGDLRIEDHTGQLLAVSDYGSAGILRGYLALTF